MQHIILYMYYYIITSNIYFTLLYHIFNIINFNIILIIAHSKAVNTSFNKLQLYNLINYIIL